MKKEILEIQKNINEMKKEILSYQENQRKEIKKEMELLFEDYLKRKKEEEEMKKKQKEELIRQQEELIRQKEEERLNFNDNVNYLNDFQCENIDNMKDINYISNSKFNLNRK